MDFTAVVAALKEIGFENLFHYEISGESLCPAEVREYKPQYIKRCTAV